jgi:tRNA modification GTPase
MTGLTDTIAACASATGGHSAVLRLSGPQAHAIAQRAGLVLGAPWTAAESAWSLAGGTCPCRVLSCPGPRSFTGCDLVEITVPGAVDLVELALAALFAAGAHPALPGGFTRQALANGRLSLDQAEAVLALAQAADADAARQALDRLCGALAERLGAVRERIIYLRALVEAGLDFSEEPDVRAFEPTALQQELANLRAEVAAFRTAADQFEGEPRVCLVGRANAGKSALFNALAGGSALVSPVAGTTRDWLDATWDVGGRNVRLVDTAGWLDAATHHLDAAAIAAGRALIDSAALILACSAPDAPLPSDHGLPSGRTLIIATKADVIGAAAHGAEAGAVLAVSADDGTGLPALRGLVAERLGAVASGEPRQQRLLARADAILGALAAHLPDDVLLADDLRRAADLLGELIGATTPDDVLNTIFGRFCIGK